MAGRAPLSSSATGSRECAPDDRLRRKDPVRRGLSVQSLASLEYWVPRLRGGRRLSVRPPSRDTLRPRFASSLPSRNRGRREDRGKTGCAPHPRSRVPLCALAKDAHEHTGSAGASRPSLRNGFTAYFVLFPENGSFASVAGKTLSRLADLTPAPRRQNHTT
jgi:hypothetical protein